MNFQTHSLVHDNFTSNNSSSCMTQIHDLRTQILHLTRMLEDEKRVRQSDHFHLSEQIRDLEVKPANPAAVPTRTSITSSRASLSSKRNIKEEEKLNIEQDNFMGHQLARCVSENRLSIHEPVVVQNSLKQDFNLMMKQFSQFKSEIKLEIAGLNDNFCDMDMNMQQCLKSIGNKGNIKVLINNVLEMEQRTSQLLSVSEKAVSDIEFLKDQVQQLTNNISQMQQIFPEELNKVSANCISLRQEVENTQTEFSDCLSRKLSKMIESYNLNFQDMDRSINEIKQVMVDVVKINKIIKDKIGIKLSNIIDNQTFHKTIEGLNQSLHSTYMLSHQKIKQIHQRDYEVQHELHQMKDALDYLQSDFGYNYSRLRLNESHTSDDREVIDTFPDQTSTLVSQHMTKFKKNKVISNHVHQPSKKDGRFRTQNDDDTGQSKNSSLKKGSLAEQLRQLQFQ